jgi:hypothetical protein
MDGNNNQTQGPPPVIVPQQPISQSPLEVNSNSPVTPIPIDNQNTPAKPKENIFLKIFRYLLVVFSLLSVFSTIFNFGILQLIGSVYYLITAIFLIKRPKIGYILFAVATILFFGALIVYRLTAIY